MVLPNSTDKFEEVLVGSKGMANQHRTRGCKPCLVGVIYKNSYEECDVFSEKKRDNKRKGKNAVQARKKLTNVYGEVYDHLKGLGLSSKLDAWAPHVLTERNLCRRIDVCDSLLKRDENYPFSKRIITGDEKGHGVKKMNRLTQFPKPIFTKKSFLPDKTTINSEVYCHQLDKLNDALQQKRSELINRKGVVFHQDNARPHTSLVTRQKLLQLKWDTMPHHHILQTWHHRIICSGHSKIFRW
ncbi:histone-lysine N-methyltransferase SETMAR [Trichonephila clavipes]|nr:histone-lysine N-methyltransferase SETMAR [Trichonephila clavipes]